MSRYPRRTAARVTALLTLAAVGLAACGGGGDSTDTSDGATTAPEATDATSDETASTGAAADDCTVTVYSGRGEDLVAPIIDRFTTSTGIPVEVRYGNSAEMLLLIQEEGDNTPADVYYAQGAGFLGTLSQSGLLAPLSEETLARVVDPELRSPAGDWVGLTGRARTVVYNTDRLTEADVPDSLTGFTDPEWSGRIGWAPTNASFQDQVTALRFLIGEDGARAWLEGMIANEPVEYENNAAILDAVAAGEVDVGLTNHYYLYRRLAEDPSFPVANKYYTDGDPGALVNIAGAGILSTSDCAESSAALIDYLLGVEAQTYFTEANFELPVVADVEVPEGLPAVDTLVLPVFDLNLLLDLEGTVDLLIDVGAL